MLYLLIALLLLHTGGRATASPDHPERLFYLVHNESSIQSFLKHADEVDIIAPQTFYVDSDGVVWGSVDPRVIRRAREAGVKVVPLIVNPGFDQALMHDLLSDEAAQEEILQQLVAYAKASGYVGWQFDFENIHDKTVGLASGGSPRDSSVGGSRPSIG